jgi:hypothetical protein
MDEVQKTVLHSEISGFHGSDYEDGCLLGCRAVKSGNNLQQFSVFNNFTQLLS